MLKNSNVLFEELQVFLDLHSPSLGRELVVNFNDKMIPSRTLSYLLAHPSELHTFRFDNLLVLEPWILTETAPSVSNIPSLQITTSPADNCAWVRPMLQQLTVTAPWLTNLTLKRRPFSVGCVDVTPELNQLLLSGQLQTLELSKGFYVDMDRIRNTLLRGSSALEVFSVDCCSRTKEHLSLAAEILESNTRLVQYDVKPLVRDTDTGRFILRQTRLNRFGRGKLKNGGTSTADLIPILREVTNDGVGLLHMEKDTVDVFFGLLGEEPSLWCHSA
jgi:hypothetical protein